MFSNTDNQQFKMTGATDVKFFIGYAAEDLKPDTGYLEVVIPQMSPALTGSVSAAKYNRDVEYVDVDGNPVNERVTTGTTITANYIGSPNRKYPPTIKRGEQVFVKQFDGADSYYWESAGRDPEVRTREVYRMEIAARPKGNAPLTDDDTYYLEINSQTGRIVVKTSNKLGEKARYTLDINTAEGTVLFGDSTGNAFQINTENKQVAMVNAGDASVTLNNRTVSIAAPEDIILSAGRQLILNTPGMTHKTTSGGALVLDVNELSIVSSARVAIDSPIVGVTGQLKTSADILSGGIHLANGFGNAGDPGAVTGAAVDLSNGAITSGSGSATDSPGYGAALRHATAWEDFETIINEIEAMFVEVEASIGVPIGSSGRLTQFVDDAKMLKIRGE
jgi:hypothetical protein